MKKNYLGKMSTLIAVAMFVFGLTSCGEDEPKVTGIQEVSPSGGYGGDISFYGSKKYTLWDSNRTCPNAHNYEFRVTKSNQIINSADRCDHCGHAWYVHDKK